MTWRQGSAAVYVFIISILIQMSAVQAQQVINIGDVGGSGGIRLEFWDNTSGPNQDGTLNWVPSPEDVRVLGTWTPDQIAAVTRGTNYWWDVLGDHNTPGRDITFIIAMNAEINENGTWFPLSTSSESPELIIDGVRTSVMNHVWANGSAAPSPWIADGLIMFDESGWSSFNTKPGGPLDNGAGFNMEATMIHEIAHSLGGITGKPFGSSATYPPGQPAEGMLRLYEQQIIDEHGNPVVAGQTYDGDSVFYFNGANAVSVFGRPIPLTTRSTEKAHLGVSPFLFTHEQFRNYIFFTEVELALLQDLGYEINRRDHFGRSYYQDGDTHPDVNNESYSLSKTYGVGVHIYSHDHQLIQKGDITSNGYAGTGIRVDGVDNTIIIDTETTITTNGDYGTGVLVSNGVGNNIVHRGTIIAQSKTEDAGGTGIYIDFGENLLGGSSRTSSTLGVDYRGDGNPVISYLVDQVDITGSIFATKDAIRVGEYAGVKDINIMGNAEIEGDIDIYSHTSTQFNIQRTNLNFGYLADDEGRKTEISDRDYRLIYGGYLQSHGAVNIIGGIDDEIGVRFNGDFRIETLNAGSDGKLTVAGQGSGRNSVNNGQLNLEQDARISLTNSFTNEGEMTLNKGLIQTEARLVNSGTIHSNEGTLYARFGTMIFDSGSSYSGVNDLLYQFDYSSGTGIDIYGSVSSKDGTFESWSNITVFDGGYLSGTPMLKAKNVIIEHGGTIAPGNSIGTITVDGNFISNGDLELEVTANPIGQDSDRFVVQNGAAWINTNSFATRGTFNFTGDQPTTPDVNEIGRRYQIIETDAPGNLLVGYRPRATDNLDERRLILRTDTEVSGFGAGNAQYYYAYMGRDVPFEELAQTSNERSIAAFLDSVKLLDDNSDEANQIQWLRDTLDLLPDEADVRSAFRQLSGDIYGSVNPMILQQMQSSYTRFAAASRNNSAQCERDSRPMEASGIYGSITGFGTGGHVHSDGNATGYSFGAGGTQVQVGYGQNDVQVGGYYNFTNGSLRGNGSAGIEIHDFGGYLVRKGELTQFLVGVGGGFATADVRRNISFGNTDIQTPYQNSFSSSSTSDILGAFGEYALNLELEWFTLRPFTGLSYAGVASADVDEGDAPLALAGDRMSLDSFRSMLGADVSFCLPNVPRAVLDLRAMWMHEFQNQSSGLLVISDADGGAIQTSGVNLGSDFAVIGATLSRELAGGRTRLFGSYDLVANSRQTLNTGSGGIEFLW